jgi:hypothetical protein
MSNLIQAITEKNFALAEKRLEERLEAIAEAHLLEKKKEVSKTLGGDKTVLVTIKGDPARKGGGGVKRITKAEYDKNSSKYDLALEESEQLDEVSYRKLRNYIPRANASIDRLRAKGKHWKADDREDWANKAQDKIDLANNRARVSAAMDPKDRKTPYDKPKIVKNLPEEYEKEKAKDVLDDKECSKMKADKPALHKKMKEIAKKAVKKHEKTKEHLEETTEASRANYRTTASAHKAAYDFVAGRPGNVSPNERAEARKKSAKRDRGIRISRRLDARAKEKLEEGVKHLVATALKGKKIQKITSQTANLSPERQAHYIKKINKITGKLKESQLDEGRYRGIRNKKRKSSLAMQTQDLRKTFGVAPGNRRRQGPRTAKLEEKINWNGVRRTIAKAADNPWTMGAAALGASAIHPALGPPTVAAFALNQMRKKRGLMAKNWEKMPVSEEAHYGLNRSDLKKVPGMVRASARAAGNDLKKNIMPDVKAAAGVIKSKVKGLMKEGKLKNWAIEFEEKHGRKPNNDDMRNERETRAYEAAGRIRGLAQRIRDEKKNKGK